MERLIFEISVKEWTFLLFLHKWPCKIRNTYGGVMCYDKLSEHILGTEI